MIDNKKNIRKNVICVRFDDNELAIINANSTAIKMEKAVYIRNSALNQKIKLPKKFFIDEKLLFQLNKIGNNLNQIAKFCNNGNDENLKLQISEIQYIINIFIESIINDS